jgi:hypothetical protein
VLCEFVNVTRNDEKLGMPRGSFQTSQESPDM